MNIILKSPLRNCLTQALIPLLWGIQLIAVEINDKDVISIGQHRQLFIDDYLIEKTENIIRRLIPFAKDSNNPLVVADQPWEARMAVPQGSVIFDEEDHIYKMWYTTDIQSKAKGLAYATSKDGLNWNKPQLDIVTRNGRKTNLVIPAFKMGFMYQPYCVVKDLGASDPAQRYKLAFLSIQRDLPRDESSAHPGTRRGLGIAFSPNGLNWTKIKDFASDDIIDISHILREEDDSFVIYGRTLFVQPEIRDAWGHHPWFEEHYNGRSVIRSTSQDFLEWTPADFILGPDLNDPVSTMIYSMNVIPYQGIYLGFAQRYISQPGIGTIDIQLAISRDGLHFERPFRDPIIPLGEVGSWDRFMIHPMSGPPIEEDEHLHFYYGGRNYRHRPTSIADEGTPTGSIGRASALRDRFVSVEASYDGGNLVTKPFQFDGSQLYVNANTAFGELSIQILNASGQAIKDFETTLTGMDATEIPIHFNGKKIHSLQAEPIRLKFTLRNVQLYSFNIL